MSKRTRLAGVTAVATIAAVGILAGTSLAQSNHSSRAQATSVCLVTDVGGLNDKGFNHLAYVGLQQAQSKLGVQGRVIESHSGSDYIPNLLSCVQGGADLTIAVGFLMEDSLNAVATRFPNSKFAIVDGSYTDLAGKPANTRGILFREQEAGYLVGWLAIQELKVQKRKLVIGAVGGIEVPAVDKYIAGYQAGAKAADPKAKVLYGFSQSFTDQAKCKEVALNQIAQGSQAEFGVAGQCGLGALDAAKEHNGWGIGVDADQLYLGPHMLTSAVKRVDQAVFDTIKAVHDHKFVGGRNAVFGLKDDGVGLGKVSRRVPKSELAQVQNVRREIVAGKIKIPTTVG